MKPTRLQFGVRENTTPSRQHASRRVNRGSSNVVSVGGEPIDVNGLSVPSEDSATVQQPSLHAAPLCAATGEDGISEDLLLTVHEVAELLRVPVSWVYGRTRKRWTQRLPGYRLGKYWRFSQADVLAWIERQRSVTR